MTPASIIRGASADGVSLAISPTGNITAKGAGEAVRRWAPIVRENKPALLDVLRQAQAQQKSPQGFNLDVFEERAAIMEYDGGLSRNEAERLAASAQGYSLAAVRRWLH